MKGIKITFLIIAVASIAVIGGAIYFVAGVSAVFPPIKSYEYPGSIAHLENGLRNLTAANPNLKFKMTDTTGNKENGYAYYFTVELKDKINDIEYNIVYNKTDYWFKADKTQIELVGAFDNIHKTGGYGITAVGVKELVVLFEENCLYKLIKK